MNDDLPDLSRRGFVGALPLLSALPAWLGAQPARAAPQPRWDFGLPTLEGDRFVRLSALRGPVLVNFWGRDCPACVSELPRLQAFAREQGDWTLLLVATDAPQEARAFLEKQGIALQALKSGPDVRR